MEPENIRSCAKVSFYMSQIQPIDAVVYHVLPDFIEHFFDEVSGSPIRVDGDLYTYEKQSKNIYWVKNIWNKPFIADFDSISDAATLLKNIQRNWAPYTYRLARRTHLIKEKLPYISDKPKPFPYFAPQTPMGSFTLIDEHHLLASASCSSPWPCGSIQFEEDHINPPGRAYRKLWEAFALAQKLPQRGERCIDAGASPGSWTWVLASLGAEVLAIDRAPLAPSIAALQGVTYLKHNAFTLKPESLGPVDWLFSDVICYPPALYEWIAEWVEKKLAKNYICTIKMQGKAWDAATTAKFANIPGSTVIHLHHNKHELTWMLLQ